jgi:hypothetical protein
MRSAFSMTIRLAFGTSTPTSITVVATSRSRRPALNACITVSLRAGGIRPCTSPIRSSGSASASAAAVSSAAWWRTSSDSSISGHTQYAWRPAPHAAWIRATTSSRRVSGITTVRIGVRPGGSSSMIETSRSA